MNCRKVVQDCLRRNIPYHRLSPNPNPSRTPPSSCASCSCVCDGRTRRSNGACRDCRREGRPSLAGRCSAATREPSALSPACEPLNTHTDTQHVQTSISLRFVYRRRQRIRRLPFRTSGNSRLEILCSSDSVSLLTLRALQMFVLLLL